MKNLKKSIVPLTFAVAAALALQTYVGAQAPAGGGQGGGGRGGARGAGGPGAGAGGGGAAGGGQARGGAGGGAGGAAGAGAARGGGRGAAGGGGGGAARGGRGGAAAGPAPRLPNGKPDLSGHWNNPYTANMAGNSAVDPATRMPIAFDRKGEQFPNAPRSAGQAASAKTFDLPYTEWGLKAWLDYDVVKNGDYTGNCLPFGMSRSINAPRGMQIVQNNDSIALLFEQNTWFHWIPTNEVFKWPKDMPESWNGISTGHWDGDTLVIETTRFNGYTRLDTTGHPHSRELKLINTLLRTDANTIQHTVTIHDPKTYSKDWMNVRNWTLQDPATTFIMEYACEENNYGADDGSITKWKKPDSVD